MEDRRISPYTGWAWTTTETTVPSSSVVARKLSSPLSRNWITSRTGSLATMRSPISNGVAGRPLYISSRIDSLYSSTITLRQARALKESGYWS